MKIPLVVAAFGTVSTEAAATYDTIDREIRRHLANTPVFWARTARVVRDRAANASGPIWHSPLEVLTELAAQGYGKAIVQPLQLLPGHEFHELRRQCVQSSLPCHVALPLLTTPQDYHGLAEALATLIDKRQEHAILLIGHGTSHPIWVAYHAIETIFRQRFGRRIYVGVIDKSPNSTTVPGEIVAAGWNKVCLIPLLFVAGMHFHRDVIGSGPHSWRTRLERAGLEVECIDRGLGRHTATVAFIAAHVEQTVNRIIGDASVWQER